MIISDLFQPRRPRSVQKQTQAEAPFKMLVKICLPLVLKGNEYKQKRVYIIGQSRREKLDFHLLLRGLPLQ